MIDHLGLIFMTACNHTVIYSKKELRCHDPIHVAAHYSQPVGDKNFRRTLSTRFNIAFGYLAHGRPRRPTPWLVKI